MSSKDIAIIGMACVFPGAKDLYQFWSNLVNGIVPQEPNGDENPASLDRKHHDLGPSRLASNMTHVKLLDLAQYGIEMDEVSIEHPEQLPILQVIAAALNDAEIASNDAIRERTDVIVAGSSGSESKIEENSAVIDHVATFLAQRFPNLSVNELAGLKSELYRIVSNLGANNISGKIPNFLVSQVASWLDLKGTCFTIDADSASALLAVEQGVSRLHQGICDAVVVLGINRVLLNEGAAAVVLKRYPDAKEAGEPIYALIKGVVSATKDCQSKNLTQSNTQQILAMQRAYKNAGVEPETIGFFEAHGIGIDVNDHSELESFNVVLGKCKLQQRVIPLGSVKSMTGHPMAVEGMASLIKAVLCLFNKIIPPTLNYKEPRKELDDVPFYINSQPYPWIRHESLPPRRAAVSDFGLDGTYAHGILEEVLHQSNKTMSRFIIPGLAWETELIVLSANTVRKLADKVRDLQEFLNRAPSDVQLMDVAFTQCLNFDASDSCRLAIVCRNLEQLRSYLDTCAVRLNAEQVQFNDIDDIYYTANSSNKPGKIVFIFPGMGFPGLLGTYVDHLQELCLHFPEVRAIFDKIDYPNQLEQEPRSASHFFSPPAYYSEPQRKRFRQRLGTPRIFTDNIIQNTDERNLAHFGVAVANWVSWILLKELDVPVDMIFGQSFGDPSALCAAKALNFEEIIPLYWQVSIDASSYISDEGRMALVSAREERLYPLLQKFQNVIIAIHVTPELQILGGKASQIESVIQHLQAEGVWTQILPFPAIHTPYFSTLWQVLQPYLEKISIKQPKIPVYSAITENVYPKNQAGIKQTLIANIDHPIRLWQTTKKMYEDGARIFVQVGGGATTHTHAKNICGTDDVIAISLDVDYRSPITQINHLCATLLTNGMTLNLKYLFKHRLPKKLALDVHHESMRSMEKEPPSVHLNTPDESSAPALETLTHYETSNPSSDSASVIKMPYIGSVLHYEPEREIMVERVLDLNEDLYLRDHLFIYAPGIKPPSACLPVLPMTFSMEVMAEVAAYLVPGLGMIGFENIRAYNWISFEDIDTLTLQISAKLENEEYKPNPCRIAVKVYIENQTSPAISGTVLFGTNYSQNLDMEFTEIENPRPYPHKVDEIYRERYLFHGPNFQCITGLGELSDQGFIGELAVLPKDHLFASLKQPGFLTDPVLLDGVGQLVGLWASAQNQYIFPIGIQKLEFYGATPPVGTRVPVLLQISRMGSKTLQANIEVQDGEDHVWMRIMGWEDWIFRWPTRLFAFTRLPQLYVLSRSISIPGLSTGCTCLTICIEDLKDFELAAIARYFLHLSEIPVFDNMADNPKRQRQWLLGRIAVKDAVRLWLRPTNAKEMLHPAEFIIQNDPNGQPVVRNITNVHSLPKISIAHANDRAIAIAGDDSIGVDLEQITEKNTSFVESFTTPNEQALLNDFPSPDQNTWIIRLWCAKEAASKVNGTGLNGRPRDFEAIQLNPNGRITIKHASSEQTYVVNTRLEQDFIIALATDL